MPNHFVYVQLHTQNTKVVAAFYDKLFDWRIEGARDDETSYLEICTDSSSKAIGGMMKCASPRASSQWIPFVSVDDVDFYAERAQSLRGTLLVAPTDVPGKGRFSVLCDPGGATFAIWKAASQ